jgi:hypothetical protein
MPRLIGLAVATLAVLAPAAQESGGDAAAGCSPCRIDLTRTLVLDAGLASPGPPRAWARGSDGRLYIVSERAPFEIVVLSPAGRYLSTMGREGSEPGEFREIGALVHRPDGLDVFDARARRITLLDDAGAAVRRAALPLAVTDAIAADGEGWWVAGRSPAPDSLARPLHRVGPSGALERSVGAPAPTDWRGVHALGREIARAPGGGFWSARRLSYRLESHDAEGEVRAELDLGGAEFRARELPAPVRPDEPPPPHIRDLRVSTEGDLLVLQHTAAATWAAGLSPETHPTPDGPAHEIIDLDAAWNSRLEVVDTTGERVAVGETDALLYGFVDDATILGYDEPDGRGRWSLWEWRLSEGSLPDAGGEDRGPSVPRLALWFAAFGLTLGLLARRVWRDAGP